MRPLALAVSIALVGLSACEPDPGPSAGAAPEACPAVTAIEGAYACSGVCAAADGSLQGPFSETDTVQSLGDSLGALYTVSIEGGGGFRETEIGALSGTTLRTATAAVNRGGVPVIEEYVFETDGACEAVGFRKIVRGLADGEFKACAVDCRRAAAGGA